MNLKQYWRHIKHALNIDIESFSPTFDNHIFSPVDGDPEKCVCLICGFESTWKFVNKFYELEDEEKS